MKRYDEIRDKARQVNHELRVVTFPGQTYTGQEFTLKLLADQPADLKAALDAIEDYLDSPQAKRRGELYKDADSKRVAYLMALRASSKARQAWLAAVKLIGEDVDGALSAQESKEEKPRPGLPDRPALGTLFNYSEIVDGQYKRRSVNVDDIFLEVWDEMMPKLWEDEPAGWRRTLASAVELRGHS